MSIDKIDSVACAVLASVQKAEIKIERLNRLYDAARDVSMLKAGEKKAQQPARRSWRQKLGVAARYILRLAALGAIALSYKQRKTLQDALEDSRIQSTRADAESKGKIAELTSMLNKSELKLLNAEGTKNFEIETLKQNLKKDRLKNALETERKARKANIMESKANQEIELLKSRLRLEEQINEGRKITSNQLLNELTKEGRKAEDLKKQYEEKEDELFLLKKRSAVDLDKEEDTQTAKNKRAVARDIRTYAYDYDDDSLRYKAAIKARKEQQRTQAMIERMQNANKGMYRSS
tara:strand:- start:1999 stop:2877 length:879 start_codon:yes stop_codon:yes gene_type:complete